MKSSVRSLVYAAVCVALGLFLPFLIGQIPELGQKLSPMHIPILLCGFLCGWQYGLVAGFITPLLRSFLFGMPALMPNALGMAFELAAYGLFTGLLYRAFPKRPVFVYVTLICSMLLGRLVWGMAAAPLYLASGKDFGLAIFWANGFANAVPAIILHIAIIPPIVLALRRAKIIR